MHSPTPDIHRAVPKTARAPPPRRHRCASKSCANRPRCLCRCLISAPPTDERMATRPFLGAIHRRARTQCWRPSATSKPKRKHSKPVSVGAAKYILGRARSASRSSSVFDTRRVYHNAVKLPSHVTPSPIRRLHAPHRGRANPHLARNVGKRSASSATSKCSRTWRGGLVSQSW